MSPQDNRFYREAPTHLGVMLQLDRKQADQLLAHLCEVERLADLHPKQAAELHQVRCLIAESIVKYDAHQRTKATAA